MAVNLKKAGSIIRKSFRSSKRSANFECKENINMSMDAPQRKPGNDRYRARTLSASGASSDESADVSTIAHLGSPVQLPQPWLMRGTRVTQSMRGAVGSLRQKLRMSTRRARLHVTPTRVGMRRNTIGGRDASLRSPFKAATPTRSGRTHIKTCLSVETPTRLRREVESLTSNMQALNALTPNKLEGTARTRKSPLLTNGSLKSRRSTNTRMATEIY